MNNPTEQAPAMSDAIKDIRNFLLCFVGSAPGDPLEVPVEFEDSMRFTQGWDAARQALDDIDNLLVSVRPFMNMANELDRRDWPDDRIILTLDNPGNINRLYVAHFFNLRATVTGERDLDKDTDNDAASEAKAITREDRDFNKLNFLESKEALARNSANYNASKVYRELYGAMKYETALSETETRLTRALTLLGRALETSSALGQAVHDDCPLSQEIDSFLRECGR